MVRIIQNIRTRSTACFIQRSWCIESASYSLPVGAAKNHLKYFSGHLRPSYSPPFGRGQGRGVARANTKEEFLLLARAERARADNQWGRGRATFGPPLAPPKRRGTNRFLKPLWTSYLRPSSSPSQREGNKAV